MCQIRTRSFGNCNYRDLIRLTTHYLHAENIPTYVDMPIRRQLLP